VRTYLSAMLLRPATPDDAPAVAALHADSWRRHYRGAYSDDFLDGDVDADRLAVWTERLTDAAAATSTTVAVDDGEVVGFVHTVFDESPEWGALLDNLHVVFGRKRHGVGRRLMAASALAVVERGGSPALYLWVLEGNTAAQAFYEAQGGVRSGSKRSTPPGGGEIVAFRYAWADASSLLPPG